jgi:2-polyprenyl-3-methyl-5-hydroxy-6-metoxy-1,4-benzoquinol methylase
MIRAISRSYDRLATRTYARARFAILRESLLEEIGQYVPCSGDILDLGCGFGLFALYFAALAPGRQVTGIDLDLARTNAAKASAAKLGIGNVEFMAEDVLVWEGNAHFDAIYVLDLIHHLPRAEVAAVLSRLRASLRPNGVLLIKDVARTPWHKMVFTLLLDRLVVGREPIHYWDPDELVGLLRDLGFAVVRHRMNDVLPYPHILYVCRLVRSYPVRPGTHKASSLN